MCTHTGAETVQAVCNSSLMSAAQGITVHAAFTPQTLHVSNTCSPPAAFSCLYHDTSVPCSVIGPFLWLVAWNSLPDYLQDPTRSFDSFRCDLKTFLFLFYCLLMCAQVAPSGECLRGIGPPGRMLAKDLVPSVSGCLYPLG